MKKLDFFSFLMSLVVISFFSSCSSTKYGAHFQAGNNHSHSYAKQDKAKETNPIPQAEISSETADGIEAPVEAVSATKDASSPIASVKEVKGASEAPEAEDLTKRQEEVIMEVKERVQHMTPKEKRELRREVRKIRLADYTKDLPLYENLGVQDIQQETQVNILALIFAILIPPLGVFLHQGEINNKFWISLLLTLLFVVPGIVYSVLVVLGIV